MSFLDERDDGPKLRFDVGGREPWPLLELTDENYVGAKRSASAVYQWVNTEEFPVESVRGNFYVNSEGEGLCPYCLKGKLFATTYW